MHARGDGDSKVLLERSHNGSPDRHTRTRKAPSPRARERVRIEAVAHNIDRRFALCHIQRRLNKPRCGDDCICGDNTNPRAVLHRVEI